MEPGGDFSGGSTQYETHQENVTKAVQDLTNELNGLEENEKIARISEMAKEMKVSGLSNGEVIHMYATKKLLGEVGQENETA